MNWPAAAKATGAVGGLLTLSIAYSVYPEITITAIALLGLCVLWLGIYEIFKGNNW